MNIVYYLETFPKLSESFVLNEIYELDQNGHNIAVCALNQPDDSIVHEEFDQLDIPTAYIANPGYRDVSELASTTVLCPRVLSGAVYPADPRYHATNLFRAKQCIKFLKSLNWNVDHVHTHFANISKFAARHISDYFRVPLTITAHAADIYREPVKRYTRDLLRSADRVVTISEYNRTYLHDRFGVESSIEIVRAGIRPDKFLPTNTTIPNRILTIARLVEKKGIKYALEAVKKTINEFPDVEYHIIGSGPLKSDLQQKAKQLEIEDHVSFLENVTDQQLVSELDQARCFLLPCVIAESGDRDGIPVALMEAMAMKTPPISTTVSGIPELIDHKKNGLLTEPRDAKATANALTELLRNDSQWNTFSKRAQQKVVNEFNIKNEAKKLEAVFQSF